MIGRLVLGFAVLVVTTRVGHADEQATANATFQKQLAETNAACGTKFPGTIDWKSWADPLGKKTTSPGTVASRDLCGNVLNVLETDLCTDDAGKAAAKAITSYRCTWVGDKGDGKHSFAGGVLTASPTIFADLMWVNDVISEHFPNLHAARVISKLVKDAESDWKDTIKEIAPSLVLDVDIAAFAAKRYPDGAKRCLDDIRQLVKFLGTTYGETENKPGRALLKRIKRAQCTVGEEPAAVIKSDTLIYTMQAAGKPGGRFTGDPEGWAWAYNELRATAKLGGKCAGASMGDASPACENAKGGIPKKKK